MKTSTSATTTGRITQRSWWANTRGVSKSKRSRYDRYSASATSLLAEEAPYAYKDVSQVVGVVEAAGLSRRVARLRPLGVLKG